MSGKPKGNDTYARARIQAPLLALIHVALAYLLAWLVPLPLAVPPLLQIAGFVLVIFGFLLGLVALIAVRQARKEDTHKRPVPQLVTSGVYRLTRNPVYLGFVLIVVGMSLDSGSYWGILLAPILVILFNKLVITQEEENLARQFGKDYTNYRAQVRRWL